HALTGTEECVVGLDPQDITNLAALVQHRLRVAGHTEKRCRALETTIHRGQPFRQVFGDAVHQECGTFVADPQGAQFAPDEECTVENLFHGFAFISTHAPSHKSDMVAKLGVWSAGWDW